MVRKKRPRAARSPSASRSWRAAFQSVAAARGSRDQDQPEQQLHGVVLRSGAFLADLGDVEGCRQVNLRQPVAVEQVGMAAPAVRRRASGIVVGIVMNRQPDLRPVDLCRGQVTAVFLVQRAAVVFEMVEDVERAVRGVLHQRRTDLGGMEQHGQPGRLDLVAAHLGPAAHGHHQIVGKPPEIRAFRGEVHVTVAAEELFGQQVFPHAVEMVDHRHAAPADAEGRMHMGLRPSRRPGSVRPNR